MHREVKPTGVLPLKVKVEVGLLGCDPPDIATRKVVVRAQGYEDSRLLTA